MKLNRLLLPALLVATIAYLPGCDKARERGSHKKVVASTTKQAIKINIVNEPANLDHRKAVSLRDINLTKMFMEGLTRLKQNEEPTMAAAESVSVSEDGLVYTFKLRDTKWSNNEPVRSNDFAYSWKRVLSPEFASETAHHLFVVKNAADVKNGDLPVSLLGVSCPDEKTLVVTLEHPVPYFLKLVANPVFYPVHQNTDKKNANWAFSVETFVGNGPFKMETWNHHSKIVAVKNEGYWDQSNVKLEQIEMLMVSEDTGLQMFDQKQLQWGGEPYSSLPVDSLNALKEKHTLNSLPALGTYWIETNTNKGPLSSVELRKAFALAINRQEIVEYVTQGNQQPTTGIVPIAMGLQNEPYFKDADYKTALQSFETCLEKLGIEKESLNSLKLSYVNNDTSHKIAGALQQQWFETLGVLVKLDPVDASDYRQRIASNEFDLICSNYNVDVADPAEILGLFSPKAQLATTTKWANAEYDQTLQSSFICKKSDRQALLRNSEKMIMDAMPVIPLFNNTLLYVKDTRLKSVELSSGGQIDFKWAYIDTI